MKTPKKPGPKKLDTRLFKGAAVEALALAGVAPSQIAEDLGIGVSLVDDILNGRGRWASLRTDQALQEYRQKQTRIHELMARELSTKALQRVEDTISKASLSQAVIAFGILQDKSRLLAGESTQNIAFGGSVRLESEKLTNTLARLLNSLKDDPLEATVVDVGEVICPITPATEVLSKLATGLGLADGTG
jgi:hypothetical protein